jgi:pimeloyl-ACP methyl ester carboxylesterase
MTTAIRQEEDDHCRLWSEYYQAFPAFSAETVRFGCHPRKMVHPEGASRAIVLLHGLSDSPYFMSALGEFFYTALGYDVYLPLLHCHGLQSPRDMAGVALDEWLRNVDFAIDAAARGGAEVSIGGLSMGGALAFYSACTRKERIRGDLYLFSAAFGLPDGPYALPGRLKEWLLRLPFAAKLSRKSPLLGKNPYRYDRVSFHGAVELAKLLGRIRRVSPGLSLRSTSARRMFVAWSECDAVIKLSHLRQLHQAGEPEHVAAFILPAALRVPHASVVLSEPIFAVDTDSRAALLEPANPRFIEMLAAIRGFATFCGGD